MNIDDLKFDEDGSCTVSVGDSFFVDIRRDERFSRYVLTSPVAAELPESITYSDMLDLLDFALGPVFDGSPAIARDPSSGAILVYSILPFAIATAVDFPEQFRAFAAFRVSMHERLAAIERGEAGAGSPPEVILGASALSV